MYPNTQLQERVEPTAKDAALLVEFKNGKLLFKQKPTSFDKLSETMQGSLIAFRLLLRSLGSSSLAGLAEIVKFRAMLEDRIAKNDIPMDSISDEYMPVIAKLVHERWV
jgi:chromatin assembly factor 1 subunit A